MAQWVVRVAGVVGGLVLIWLGWLAIAIGGCHSSGGFCAGSFTDDFVGALVIGGFAVVGGFTLVTRGVLCRSWSIGVGAIVGLVVATAMIIPQLP